MYTFHLEISTMLPCDQFRELLNRLYGAMRARRILDQLASAQDTVGFETIVAELSELQTTPAHYLLIREPGTTKVRMEVLNIGEYLIGRAETCKIVIENQYTSRFHALITVHTDEHITIRDLSSSNGIKVNDVPVPPNDKRILHVGDKILLGKTSATITKL